MANSGQDPKVEDVLSSVRRLVSQEIPKPPVAKAPPDDGALVLTSKDRITADHTARVTARTLEQRIAELEAAVDNASDEFEPDGSEDPSLHQPDRIVYTRPRSTETEVQQERSPLRLSEISVIPPKQDAEIEDVVEAPVEFRRGPTSKPWSTATLAETPVESPMTKEPAPQVPTTAEVARQAPAKAADPVPEAPEAEKPVPEAPMAEDVPTLPASSADLRAFSDPDDVVARIEARIERGETAPEEKPEPAGGEDFDTALSAAVRASLFSAKPTDEADTADTLSYEETYADPAPEVKAAWSDTPVEAGKEASEPSDASEAEVAARVRLATEEAEAGEQSSEPVEPVAEAPSELTVEDQVAKLFDTADADAPTPASEGVQADPETVDDAIEAPHQDDTQLADATDTEAGVTEAETGTETETTASEPMGEEVATDAPSAPEETEAAAVKPAETVLKTVEEPNDNSGAETAKTFSTSATAGVEEAAQIPSAAQAEPVETNATEAAASALAALPDDEATRLLVARLLREELQGDLGKQITRNVRKLVRSEILRVIETRTLD